MPTGYQRRDPEIKTKNSARNETLSVTMNID